MTRNRPQLSVEMEPHEGENAQHVAIGVSSIQLLVKMSPQFRYSAIYIANIEVQTKDHQRA